MSVKTCGNWDCSVLEFTDAIILIHSKHDVVVSRCSKCKMIKDGGMYVIAPHHLLTSTKKHELRVANIKNELRKRGMLAARDKHRLEKLYYPRPIIRSFPC